MGHKSKKCCATCNSCDKGFGIGELQTFGRLYSTMQNVNVPLYDGGSSDPPNTVTFPLSNDTSLPDISLLLLNPGISTTFGRSDAELISDCNELKRRCLSGFLGSEIFCELQRQICLANPRV